MYSTRIRTFFMHVLYTHTYTNTLTHSHILTHASTHTHTRATMSSHIVDDTEDDTKQHLHDTKDNGHLHLVRVGEDEVIHRHCPYLHTVEGMGKR